MTREWIAFEHYRLHCTEQWRESERKRATIAAIRSNLASLGAAGDAEICMICADRARPRFEVIQGGRMYAKTQEQRTIATVEVLPKLANSR